MPSHARPGPHAPSGAEDILRAARPRRLALRDRGIEIALLEWGGPGPLALLHHANGFCKGTWGLVAQALSGRYQVVAMDARGHGDSSRPAGDDAYAWDRFAEDVVAVGERLAAEHPAKQIALGMGSSFGGTAILGAAARRPQLFERIVLVDAVVPAPPQIQLPADRRAGIDRLVRGARGRRGTWPSRAAARAHCAARSLFARWDPRALDLYVLDGMREHPDGTVELKCPGEIEATIFAATAQLDLFMLVRGATTPTLFLWAAEGDFPRPVYEALAASMVDARVETVQAGHLVPMERPNLVVEAVLRFAHPHDGQCGDHAGRS